MLFRSEIPDDIFEKMSSRAWAERIHKRSPYELEFHIPFAEISVDYENGPFCIPGEAKTVIVKTVLYTGIYDDLSWRWLLPESWQAEPAVGHVLALYSGEGKLSAKFIPGDFDDAVTFIPLEVSLASRRNKIILRIPFVRQGSFNYLVGQLPDKFMRNWRRVTCDPHLPLVGLHAQPGINE